MRHARRTPQPTRQVHMPCPAFFYKKKAKQHPGHSRLVLREDSFFRGLWGFICVVCGCAAFRSWLSSRPSNSTPHDGRRTADAQHYSCVWNGQMNASIRQRVLSIHLFGGGAFAQQAVRVLSLCTSTWWRSGWTATQSATATGSGTCTSTTQAHPSVS